ncbi:hypothetical protein BJX68DRAFT_113689 [Aspergillus pseudodeflectus]|uniref:Uncharacterized protein n=1 Tax=Aspergillus pseudodeflectus TaxID=176178 RepID=A0ABR4L3Q0_9EURO
MCNKHCPDCIYQAFPDRFYLSAHPINIVPTTLFFLFSSLIVYPGELVRASSWSSVEVCTAILIASIPSLRKLLVSAYPSMRRIFHLSCSGERGEGNNSTHVRSDDQGYFAVTVAQRPATTPDCFPLPSPGLPEETRIGMFSFPGGVAPVTSAAMVQCSDESKA